MNTIQNETIEEYTAYLQAKRRALATVQKYAHYISQFSRWVENRPFIREAFAQWMGELTVSPRTANGAISAVNGFATFIKHPEIHLELNKIETPYYRAERKELTKQEYELLLETALRVGNERIYLTMMTIAALGIRVSELADITVQAIRRGEAQITNKGKTRGIVIPGKLRSKLDTYCRKRGIQSESVFITRNGKPLSRGQILVELKNMAKGAGVALGQVFPHNLRHLFAVLHYRTHKDIYILSRILGHSSVKNTQIYLTTSSQILSYGMEVLGIIQ